MSNKDNMNTPIPDDVAFDKDELLDSLEDEFADEVSASEKIPPDPLKKSTSPVKIVLCLVLICAFIAALLGAVNGLTKGKIAENTALEKERAIQSIFGSSVTIEEYSEHTSAEPMEAYLIFKSGMLYGYCANVYPSGFGGEISMMVGVDHTGAVCGVNIVTMSETPGLGTKTNTAEFLSQFIGKKEAVSPGSGIDAISGATVSSEAICAGVNTALAAGIDLSAISQQRVIPIYSAELDTAPPETESAPEETTGAPEVSPQTEPADSGRLEDTVAYVDQIENPNPAPDEERPGVTIEVYDDTMVYITETTAPDTDETDEEDPGDTEEETTTRAPETTDPPETTKTPETTTKAPDTTNPPQTTEPVTTEPATTEPVTEPVTTEPITTEPVTDPPESAEDTTERVEETTGPADDTAADNT